MRYAYLNSPFPFNALINHSIMSNLVKCFFVLPIRFCVLPILCFLFHPFGIDFRFRLENDFSLSWTGPAHLVPAQTCAKMQGQLIIMLLWFACQMTTISSG